MLLLDGGEVTNKHDVNNCCGKLRKLMSKQNTVYYAIKCLYFLYNISRSTNDGTTFECLKEQILQFSSVTVVFVSLMCQNSSFNEAF